MSNQQHIRAMENYINTSDVDASNNKEVDTYREKFNELNDSPLDTKDDLNAFIKKCQDFAASVEDVSKAKNMLEAIHHKFYSIIKKYDDEMDVLFNEWMENGVANKVNTLRKKADEIYDTASIALQIIDVLPNELTTKADYLQNNDNSVSVWALFATKAQKLVSDEIAKTDIYAKDKFTKLYANKDKHNVDNIYLDIERRINDLIEATCDNHIAHGKFKLSKLIVDVFNHQPITQIKRKDDTRRTTVDLIDRRNLLLFIPAFAMPFIGFFLYGKLAMIFCVLLVGIVQVLFIWPKLEKSTQKTIPVSKIDNYVESEKGTDITIRCLCIILGLLNVFPFLASNSAFMQAIRGNSVKVYEGGFLVTILTIIIIGVWFFHAYAMPKPAILTNKELLDKENITVEEKEELQKGVKGKLMKDAAQIAEKQFGAGYTFLTRNVVINENTNKIHINGKEYDFQDILSFDVRDNAVTIHSASVSTAKANNGNMLGRAIVGGMLFGNVGAVIGGATASRTIEHSSSQSTVVHDYSIVITVNNISSPTEIIKIGRDDTVLNKIVSTLTVILNRNTTI